MLYYPLNLTQKETKLKPEDLYIVNENPFLIQKKCQIHSRNLFTKFFIGMMIFFVLDSLVPSLLGVAFPKGYMHILVEAQNIPSNVVDLSKVKDTPMIIFLYAFFFNGVLQAGKALYALTFMRNRKVEYKALGEGFAIGIKAFLVCLAQTAIISIWTMCFIFPGIIAYYNFRQSYYILSDDPSKGVFRILAESKTRMLGNRMNLFRLDLSYISLILMAYLPVLIYGQVNVFASQPIANVVAGFIISIPLYYALSIMLMGQTVFYELLLNHGFANFRYAGQDAFRESAYPDSKQ